ncbi:copper amine oxidase N-terminal domain-containing protein [Bacillus sp. FJAT-45350]|uniref:copper amine oxidase N-terminal domain-containing protein n=1 Tax=Bacillus sp. FJAT-45350 TaxID=2011014 RepID=UPI0015CDC9D3|nr:copper amine oxidase N-terminal domain-containing protein [Bacillus sp. FJAT-45350]
MFKRLLFILPVFILTMFLVNNEGAEARTVVTIEGGTMVENRTLVPLRSIFEELGANVHWDAATKKITATKGSTKVILTVNSRHTSVNGKAVVIDVPAQVQKGRTLVPLRFVSEAMGASVDWDSQLYMATISSKEKDIFVFLPKKSSTNEQKALNLVKEYFDYDQGLSYSVENLHRGQFYLVEARADFGSGLLSLVDAFIIVPEMYSNGLYIQDILSEDGPDYFWGIVEVIRSGNFG